MGSGVSPRLASKRVTPVQSFAAMVALMFTRIAAALRTAAGTPADSFISSNDGPGGFYADAEIFAAPDAVFRLLDPTQRENRWALRGDIVEAIDAAHGLYRLTDRRMPDEPFLMQIVESRAPLLIELRTFGDGGQPFGAVEKSSSRYEISSSPQGCVVTLIERPTFVEGLSDRQRKQHARMMARAVETDVRRLKQEAERGGGVRS